MGIATLIAPKLINNDPAFFKKFTDHRGTFEDFIVESKQLVAAIIQQTSSGKRYDTIANLFDFILRKLTAGETPTEAEIIENAGVTGKVIVGGEFGGAKHFSDDTKSAFIRTALQNALRCPVCHGYLDPNKSVSYDHIKRIRQGGTGADSNCRLTHPYCNQSVRN